MPNCIFFTCIPEQKKIVLVFESYAWLISDLLERCRAWRSSLGIKTYNFWQMSKIFMFLCFYDRWFNKYVKPCLCNLY